MALHEHLVRIIIVMVFAVMLPGPGSAETSARFSDAEIESLLAPIALYPDTLLTQILIASTYPLDVVEAARFVAAHPEFQSSEAVLAAAKFDWDPGVQALTAFPEVLRRMDQDLRWTRALGEAFLQQQEAVMVSLQTLRQRARLAGTLEGAEYLHIERQGERLALAAPRQDLVYVPWYDTTSAYGQWPTPQHQPVYWAPEPTQQTEYRSARRSRSSLLWGPAIHLDPLYYSTRLDWHRRGVNVVDRRHGQPWQHRGRSHRDRVPLSHRHGARRHGEGDSMEQRQSRSWPDDPSASLSQQRVGAIDTRTASARLRALQAEAAAAAARERSDQRRSSLPLRRFGNSQQGATSQRGSTERRPDRQASTTMSSQQGAPRTRPSSSPEPSRPTSRTLNDTRRATTIRSFGGSGPHSQRSTRPAATAELSNPAPASTTRQFGGSVAPRRPN